MLYKDIIIEIALRLDNTSLLSLILSCKKYKEWIDNDNFWYKRIKYNYPSIDLNKIVWVLNFKQLYIFLNNYNLNPEKQFRKYIRSSEIQKADLLQQAFNLKFPYIGIIRDNRNDKDNKNDKDNRNDNDNEYFAILDVINLDISKIISDNIPSLNELGHLTLSTHASNMGIKTYKYTPREDIIDKIKECLISKNLIYEIGDKI